MESRNPEFHIPIELWFIILSFLPVKTLLRFRAVSKSIDDPNFVSFHVRSFPANRHETQLFILTRGKFQIHDTAIGGALIDSFETGLPGSYKFVHGPIHGISLLTDGRSRFSCAGRGPLLWNPSTRMSRQIPLPPWCVSEEGVCRKALIGYDHLCQDYKVLLGQMSEIDCQLGLYSVSKGSWKMLDNSVFGSSWSLLRCGLSFEGGMAWVVFDYDRCTQQNIRLVLFDFGTETVRYTALPFGTLKLSSNLYNLFRVDSGRALGLEADGQVWELETETMTWSSPHSIDADLTPLESVVTRKEDGELVSSTRTWTEGSLKAFSYNAKTMEVKYYEEVPMRAPDAGFMLRAWSNYKLVL